MYEHIEMLFLHILNRMSHLYRGIVNMKKDFTDKERELYLLITGLYSHWSQEQDIQKQGEVTELINEMDQKDLVKFFCKKTKIVAYRDEEATPLEHLFFAGAGFEKLSLVKSHTDNIRPEPLLFVLKNFEFEPAQLLDILSTMERAYDNLQKRDYETYKKAHGWRGSSILEDVKSCVDDLLLKVYAYQKSIKLNDAEESSRIPAQYPGVVAEEISFSAPIVTRFSTKPVVKEETPQAGSEIDKSQKNNSRKLSRNNA
jgi:hypothetical protein